MNSKIGVVAIVTITLTIGMFASSVVRAEQDFSRYSNEEMVQQRSQVSNMSKGDQVRFQAEMQTRLRHMSEGERERLGLAGNGQAAQAAQDTQLRKRLNEDNDRGQGELTRERLRIETNNGYGRGFGSRQPASGGGRGH